MEENKRINKQIQNQKASITFEEEALRKRVISMKKHKKK